MICYLIYIFQITRQWYFGLHFYSHPGLCTCKERKDKCSHMPGAQKPVLYCKNHLVEQPRVCFNWIGLALFDDSRPDRR